MNGYRLSKIFVFSLSPFFSFLLSLLSFSRPHTIREVSVCVCVYTNKKNGGKSCQRMPPEPGAHFRHTFAFFDGQFGNENSRLFTSPVFFVALLLSHLCNTLRI
jgi:hypothetical protein